MGHRHFKSDDFAPVNVVIGKNDTGKTGLLKLLYAACKAVDIYSRRIKNEDIGLKKVLTEKLIDTFQPGKKGLGDLVSKFSREKLEVDIEFKQVKLNYEDRLHFSFGESTTNTIGGQDKIKTISEQFRCLFIPAKEVLTSLKAIRATRDNLFMPGFDDTYLDLIKSLVIPTQQGNLTQELVQVNKKLEWLFELKNYSLASITSTETVEQKALDMVKKAVDSLTMFLSGKHGYAHSAGLNPCFPIIPNAATQFKFITIVHCDAAQIADVQLINDSFKRKFKPYAQLFDIRYYTVLEHSQAMRILPNNMVQ